MPEGNDEPVPDTPPELGHVTLTPAEIVPIRGWSPIEVLRRRLQRADTADAPTDTGDA